MSLFSKLSKIAFFISSFVVIFITFIPLGGLILVGPDTNVTLAPLRLASSAI